MHNHFFRFYKPGFLISLLALLAIALFFVFSHWKLSISVVSAVSLLIVPIDIWLWRFPPFSWLFWTTDFRGSYEGILQYQYISEDGETKSGQRKHIKKISQSGHHLSIRSFTYKEDGSLSSPSESEEIVVKNNGDGSYTLTYRYINKGDMQQGFPIHGGTEELYYWPGAKDKAPKLYGEYYTNRTPQTRGKLLDFKVIKD